jgi:predicted nuclease of restriction endonuclease-like (RecB) superfamily
MASMNKGLPASASPLPTDYGDALQEIKVYLRSSRIRAVAAANSIMIEAYWNIGCVIHARQQNAAWGSKVIDHLAADLQKAFPEMRGLSSRNLLSMKLFATTFPEAPITKHLVSQLPWGHIVRLMQLEKDPVIREYYISETIANGWSRAILELQIKSQLHIRAGRSVHNFAGTMSPADSELASRIFKDPYLFDFIAADRSRREAEVEQALLDHVQRFLLELGSGFAFVGRRVHLDVAGDDFYIDLLFYHLRLRRYVVVELKTRPFQPSDIGQINLYRATVDEQMCHPEDRPTIGLLLCRGKNKLVVEYALRGLDESIAVSDWKTHITETLPTEFQGSLPTIEEIETGLIDGIAITEPSNDGKS